MLQSSAWPTFQPTTPAAVQLRLLGSVRDLDGGELPELYGYPAEQNGVWLRANFIASLDGGATVRRQIGSAWADPAIGQCSVCCGNSPT